MIITDFLNLSQSKITASLILAATTLLSLVTVAANAQVVYDDAINGTASSSGVAPTLVDFNVGSNFINGIVSSDEEIDNPRNFYTFVIDPGQELDAIVLTSLTVRPGFEAPADEAGFYALVSGTTSETPASGFTNLGGQLYDPSDIGNDLLAPISGGGISSGTSFTTIGPGDYTFVIQQTGTEVSTYSLDFQISTTAVPEPTSAIVLIGMGLVGLARRRR